MADSPVLEVLRNHAYPACFAIAPHEIVAASDDGTVSVAFSSQPDFTNLHGVVMGGCASLMLDLVVSYACFARTRRWLPTIEMKTSYLLPLEVGACTGEGTIQRAGRTIVFAEGRLVRPDGRVAVHATATQILPGN